MKPFSFLHAADLHLDSPLRGLNRYPGLPIATIRGATRAALDNLVTLAITRGVDFVVLAGDLYDGEWQDAGTGLHMAASLGRLAAADIPVFIVRGNHDAASILMRDLALPPGIHRFSEKTAETVRLASLGVAIHGRGFAERHIRHDMTGDYPPFVPGWFNIGILHTSLAGYDGHEPYAPTTPERLAALGYDYWALGHVHERQIVSTAPHIVFPGVLQGRHIRETGAKGATIVDVRDGCASLEHVACDVVRWMRVVVACEDCAGEDALHAAIRTSLEQARADADGRLMVARLVLTGASALHAQLCADPHRLRDAAREIATMLPGEIAIEKISLRTTPPRQDTAMAQGPGDDPLAGLCDDALDDPELRAMLADELGAFIRLVPTDADPMDPDSPLSQARDGNWTAILRNARASLRARFEGAG